MSRLKVTRLGSPSGCRSSTRHSVTGPDHDGYASKSVSTAKQSSSEPAISTEWDWLKSLTAGADDNGAPGARSRVSRRARFGYASSEGRMPVRTIEWRSGRVVMLDQRLLPTREVYRVYGDHREVARARRRRRVGAGAAGGVGRAAVGRPRRGPRGRAGDRRGRAAAARAPRAGGARVALEQRAPRVGGAGAVAHEDPPHALDRPE